MIRQALFFTGPRRVEVREEQVTEPGKGQVLVETLLSGISAGTEILVYRGQAPQQMAADLTIPALSGSRLTFPLKYGYSAVGRVKRLGLGVAEIWADRLVFSFQPHQSHFVAQAVDLIPLPEGLTPEEAVFVPTMETAVGLVMDGRPLINEAVVVIGQGIVGLLTTALLSRFPLSRLLTIDPCANRRQISKRLGAEESLNPDDPDAPVRLDKLLEETAGADLVFEVSGNPAALNVAIDICGFAGRIVVGSWYGEKRGAIDLGGTFHRNRITLTSSQVSRLSPELTGRWGKVRRMATVWPWLREIRPARLITRRVPLEQAPDAYRSLDQEGDHHLQVVLTYPGRL
jgi:2-desacetyl-2-hydroxyethyl bacteriochlorophyllide A dehydrogenase